MDKSIGYFHTIDSDSDDDMASAKYRWVIFARSEIGNVVATRGYSGRVFFIALQLICFVLGLVFSLILNKITREKDRRHQAEALLVKNEEMASLGRLVAGIAHELNTPIGTSVTLASTISDEIDRFSRNISGGQIKKSQIDNSNRYHSQGIQRNTAFFEQSI